MTESSFRREDERPPTDRRRPTGGWNRPYQLYAFIVRAGRLPFNKP